MTFGYQSDCSMVTNGIAPTPENGGAPTCEAGAPRYELLRLDSNQQPSD